VRVAVADSSLLARSHGEVGEALCDSAKEYSIPLLHSLPEALQLLTLPEAEDDDKPETHAQRLLTSIWEAVCEHSQGCHFVDTHASPLVSGDMPAGFVSNIPPSDETRLSWLNCITVIEAKQLLSGSQLHTAIGQIASRFVRVQEQQDERSVLVFFLVDERGVIVGQLSPSELERWPFELRLSALIPFVGHQGMMLQLGSLVGCNSVLCSFIWWQ